MQRTSKLLHVEDHSRDVAGMTYVYPVVSRRAGGVSIGINLNPNNACNWRCIYCQVPELKRGTAPIIDLGRLEAELRAFLHEILHGNFMQAQVPPEARRINDIAFSGNGEPTSAREFEQVVELIGRVKADYDLPQELKLVLITNGSLIERDGKVADSATAVAEFEHAKKLRPDFVPARRQETHQGYAPSQGFPVGVAEDDRRLEERKRVAGGASRRRE